jgi:hypothetical protein
LEERTVTYFAFPQCLFCSLAFGNVAEYSFMVNDVSLFVVNVTAMVFHPDLGPVLSTHTICFYLFFARVQNVASTLVR